MDLYFSGIYILKYFFNCKVLPSKMQKLVPAIETQKCWNLFKYVAVDGVIHTLLVAQWKRWPLHPKSHFTFDKKTTDVCVCSKMRLH